MAFIYLKLLEIMTPSIGRVSMGRVRFSDELTIHILQGEDRSSIADVVKRLGVSERSTYSWSKTFGDLGANDLKALKQLEQESGYLRRSWQGAITRLS